MRVVGTRIPTTGEDRKIYSTVDSTATAGQTVFAVNYDEGKVACWLNGIRLVQGQDFTYTASGVGSQIALTSGIVANDYVEVVGYQGIYSGNALVEDRFVVGTNSTGSGGAYNGSAGNHTTVFPVANNTGDLVCVYRNGIKLVHTTDFTVQPTASTVTLQSASNTADEITVHVIGILQHSNFVPTSGGTFTGTVAHTGTLNVSGGTLTTSTAQKTAIVDGGKGNLTKSDVGLSNVTNHAQWHSGNDGAGSGLDADTVDSIQASSFLRSDANTTFNASGNNFNFDYDSSQRTLWTAQQSGTTKLSFEANGNALSFALHNSGTLELPASTTFGGVSTSSFLRSDAVDSASGTYTFSGGGNDVSDTPALKLTAGYISVSHDEVLLKFDEGQKMITSNDGQGNFNIRGGHDNDGLHVSSSSGNSGVAGITLDSDGTEGLVHLYVGPQRAGGQTSNCDYGLTVSRGTNGLEWRTGDASYGGNLTSSYRVWHALNSGGCRAYVQFDGEDTTTGNNVAIRVSLNISSVVDRGTGFYEVNMITAMPNDKYCVLATGTGGSTSSGYVQMDSHAFGGTGTDDQHVSSSRFNLRGTNSSGTYIDHPIVCAGAFR